MPNDFPEDALESMAQEFELTAKDWQGDGTKRGRNAIAEKWLAKAATVRLAIDAYRARTSQPPITRRQKFGAMVNELAAKMDATARQRSTPMDPSQDWQAKASGDR